MWQIGRRRLTKGTRLPIGEVMLSPGLVAEVGPTWWLRAWVGGIVALLAFGAVPIDGIDAAPIRGAVVSVVALVSFALAVRHARRAQAAGIAEAAANAGLAAAMALFGASHGVITLLGHAGDGASTLPSQVAVPIAALALVCVVHPLSPNGHVLALGWRSFLAGHRAVSLGVAVLLAGLSGWLEPAGPQTAGALIAAVAAASVALVVSRSRMLLAVRLDDATAFIGAVGLAGLGIVSVLDVAPWRSDLTGWMRDLVLVAAMWALSRGAAAGIDRDRVVADLLGPVDAAVPGCSIELGVDPVLVRLLVGSVDGDQSVRDHLRRSATLALAVASELELDPSSIRRVGLGALLHDCGKTADDRALLRSDALSPAQLAAVRAHAARGGGMVASSPLLADVAPIVRGHHERGDGAGWPDGLVGPDIAIETRIVALCDSYDAMSASPAFRRDAPRATLLAILREHSDRQWDRVGVDALARVVRRHPDERPAEARKGWCCPDAVPGALGLRRLDHSMTKATEPGR